MGGLIEDDRLHAFAVVAEPADVAAKIRRRFGGLIDRVSFYSPCEAGTQTWDLILPGLKSPAGSLSRPENRNRPIRGRPAIPR